MVETHYVAIIDICCPRTKKQKSKFRILAPWPGWCKSNMRRKMQRNVSRENPELRKSPPMGDERMVYYWETRNKAIASGTCNYWIIYL
jgi:hypothetical protein